MSTFNPKNYLDIIVFEDGSIIVDDYENSHEDDFKEYLEQANRNLLYAEHPEEIENITSDIESLKRLMEIISAIENDEDLSKYDDDDYYEIRDDEE